MHTLRIHRLVSRVTVLGPGIRAGIWVQGCNRRCVDCIAPGSWAPDQGDVMSVSELAEWVVACGDVEGVTVSGGEPFDQAGSLAHLVRLLRSFRDIGVVCYTGFMFEDIVDGQHRELLSEIDLLIDGPYMRSAHADLLWRASTNQRIHCLTERYRAEVEALLSDADESVGLEFRIDPDGVPTFIGVPSVPKFAESFAEQLRQRGIILEGRRAS